MDNVWDINDITNFLNIIGPECGLLITTRESSIAIALGINDLQIMPDQKASFALALLANWCDIPVNELPEIAKTISKECGYLPFAIALCGASIRKKISWQDLYEAFKEADLAYLDAKFPNYKFPNILKAIQVSVNTLRLGIRRAYLDLAIFSEAPFIPELVIRRFWNFRKKAPARNSGKILAELSSKNLIRMEGESPNRNIYLHDLYKDYLTNVVKNQSSLHKKLIASYEEVSTGKWDKVPDDKYYYAYLPFHLKQAGRVEEVESLLLDFNWLSAKLRATDIYSLIKDFDLIKNSKTHSNVHDCLRLSSSVLANDPDQLASQLLGRLSSKNDPKTSGLIRTASQWNTKNWIKPLYSSFLQPDDALKINTQVSGSEIIYAIAIVPDQKRLVVCSNSPLNFISTYGNVSVWDIDTGFCLREWLQPGVKCLAIHPDGYRVFTGSDNGAIEVRNINSGELIKVINSEIGRILSMVISKDGKFIGICNGWGGELMILDAETLKPKVVREDYAGDGAALAFSNDSRKVLYSDHNVLKITRFVY